MAINLY